MHAATLNCLMCGAPSRSDAPNCAHCGARLATVACPTCFGMIFQGSKYCPHCGTSVHLDTGQKTDLPCPHCKTNLEHKQIGSSKVCECAGCHGLWIEVATFEKICVDREKQSVVLGSASDAFVPGQHKANFKVRYVPCPVCSTLMHRTNFARCSGVIIDVCKRHGTWFDQDELHHIVQFIHAGGLDLAREKEKAAALAAARRLENAKRDLATTPHQTRYGGSFPFGEPDLFTIAGSVLDAFLD